MDSDGVVSRKGKTHRPPGSNETVTNDEHELHLGVNPSTSNSGYFQLRDHDSLSRRRSQGWAIRIRSQGAARRLGGNTVESENLLARVTNRSSTFWAQFVWKTLLEAKPVAIRGIVRPWKSKTILKMVELVL